MPTIMRSFSKSGWCRSVERCRTYHSSVTAFQNSVVHRGMLNQRLLLDYGKYDACVYTCRLYLIKSRDKSTIRIHRRGPEDRSKRLPPGCTKKMGGIMCPALTPHSEYTLVSFLRSQNSSETLSGLSRGRVVISRKKCELLSQQVTVRIGIALYRRRKECEKEE